MAGYLSFREEVGSRTKETLFAYMPGRLRRNTHTGHCDKYFVNKKLLKLLAGLVTAEQISAERSILHQ